MKYLKELYCCYQRGSYGGLELWGWFESDGEAIKKFKARVNEGYANHEWYIGKVIEYEKIVLGNPTTNQVAIFET